MSPAPSIVRRLRVVVGLGASFVLCGLLSGASPARPLGYHVVARWLIGGEGGWDCLATDPAARHLYVTHGTQVEVLDLGTGKKLGVVPGTVGAHGVELAPALGRGFIASGRDSAIVVFDTKTLAPLARIPVPARVPDALLYEPTTRRVFSFDGGSDNACAFDAATGAFVDSLPLGGRPEFAVHDSAGTVYVNLESTSEVVAFDARTLKIRRRWSLAPGEEPTGLAIDRARGLLLSACSNRMLVVSNARTGAIVDTLAIGEGVDGAAYDRRRHVAFTSNGDGTLTVVRPSGAGFTVAETDSTQRGARTLALDETTGRVFVVTAAFGEPPAPTAERPHPRPSIVPGTFVVLVLDRTR
jgi:hypothetical protein